LSVQLSKLKEVHCIDIQKNYRDDYPLTVATFTEVEANVLEQYLTGLEKYLKYYIAVRLALNRLSLQRC